jgi:hypothetical protein
VTILNAAGHSKWPSSSAGHWRCEIGYTCLQSTITQAMCVAYSSSSSSSSSSSGEQRQQAIAAACGKAPLYRYHALLMLVPGWMLLFLLLSELACSDALGAC